MDFALTRDIPVVLLSGYESLFGTYGFVAQIALKSPEDVCDIVLGEIELVYAPFVIATCSGG